MPKKNKVKKTKRNLLGRKNALIFVVVLLIASLLFNKFVPKNQTSSYVVEENGTSRNATSSVQYLSAPTPEVVEATPTIIDGTNSRHVDTKYGVSITFPSSWKLTLTNYLNNIPDYLLFSIYEKDVSSSRIQLYKDFQGDFCAGSPDMTTSNITLNDGTVAERYECSSSIAVNFDKNGANFWLIATFVNDDNRDDFHAMAESLLLSK